MSQSVAAAASAGRPVEPCPCPDCCDEICQGGDLAEYTRDASCPCPDCCDESCPGFAIDVSMLYYVASERPYGEGARGVFKSLKGAEDYVRTVKKELGIDCVVLRVVVNQPRSTALP